MRFRPCIDIHNGRVKQIIGSSLRDADSSASENFVSDRDAAFFARMFDRDGLSGGHVILLNREGSEGFSKTQQQAYLALSAAPGRLAAGGGIRPDNAEQYLDAGAYAVIVTSYVFRDGRIDYEKLLQMEKAVGRDRLILDLSCRKEPAENGVRYRVMTDRWQTASDTCLSGELFSDLQQHCAEFLIHAVDVEGKRGGIDAALVRDLSVWCPDRATYAGGAASLADLELLEEEGGGHVDVTVGSALSIYGGSLDYRMVCEWFSRRGGVPCNGIPGTI